MVTGEIAAIRVRVRQFVRTARWRHGRTTDSCSGDGFREMILCITPNPAIDRTLLLPHLTLGNVHRAENIMVAAGGKGLNVARTIRILGGAPLCMGFAGGHSG